jgi:hypothetical protein
MRLQNSDRKMHALKLAVSVVERKSWGADWRSGYPEWAYNLYRFRSQKWTFG